MGWDGDVPDVEAWEEVMSLSVRSPMKFSTLKFFFSSRSQSRQRRQSSANYAFHPITSRHVRLTSNELNCNTFPTFSFPSFPVPIIEGSSKSGSWTFIVRATLPPSPPLLEGLSGAVVGMGGVDVIVKGGWTGRERGEVVDDWRMGEVARLRGDYAVGKRIHSGDLCSVTILGCCEWVASCLDDIKR